MDTDSLFLLSNGDMRANKTIDIIELLMKEDFMSSVSRHTKYNMNFLYTAYPFKDQMMKAIENDPLLRFRLIDMFDERKIDIEERLRKIGELGNMYSLDGLNLLFSETKTKIDFSKMRKQEALLSHIEKNKTVFRDRFLDLYDRNKKTPPLNQTGKRLILMYYFNLFFLESGQTLRNDSEEYLEYKKYLIMFKDTYAGMNRYGYIFPSYKVEDSITLSDHERSVLNIFNGAKTYMVNKNMIAWFYICFNKKMDRQVANALLYIILNVNKNVLGMAVKIFNSFDKDYHRFSEDELEDIRQVLSEKQRYLGRVGEQIENQNVNELMNNILLLKNFRKDSETYSFLEKFDIRDLDAYTIIHIDPLTNSFENIVKQAKVKQEMLDLVLHEHSVKFGSDQFRTLFNSIQTDLNKLVFIRQYDVEELSLSDIEEDIILPIHCKEILFWYILKCISPFEILVNIKDKTLKDSIDRLYTTLDTFRIEFQQKNRESFYNGYKAIK